MTLEQTLRLSEILLALAVAQQSLEHLKHGDRLLFGLRLILCGVMAAGVAGPWPMWGLWGLGLWMLHRFQGPYNGGSDKMSLLIVTCFSLASLAPSPFWAEMAVSYLAVQLVLSYFVSGWIKVINPEWRTGRALVDVFRFSAYPVSENLRGWATRPKLLCLMSWAVMGFEVAFPLVLLHPYALYLGLLIAGAFHLANACLFGLNRFFWIWLCAYSSLI